MRAVSLVSLSLVLSSAVQAQERVLQAGTQYPAGTRVSSPWTGVSFVVPDEFSGQYDADAKTFVMTKGGPSDLVVGVYAISEATLEDIEGVVVRQLEGQGISLTPSGPPNVSANSSSGWYVATAEGVRGSVYGSARVGEPGNVIAVVALRLSEDSNGLQELVDGIVASVQYSAAGASQWRQLVAGGVLSSTGEYSNFSPGGGGTASGVSSTERTLDLCSNGQYAYQEQSETYISVEGAGSASRTSSDGHSGQWWLVSDIAGNAFLVLEATDGRDFHWSVVEQGNGVALDGTLYTLARSQRCY